VLMNLAEVDPVACLSSWDPLLAKIAKPTRSTQ
jgi:hypothetical protein